MDSKMLKENIESLEKVIDSLKDYMFDQEQLIEKMKTEIADTEEDMLFLDDLKVSYMELLKEKTDKVEIDLNESSE